VNPNDGGIPPGFIGVIHLPATTYSGWFVGGGTELMLAPSWFIRSEYRYASYGAKYTPEILNATGAELNFGQSNEKFVQTVRSELVWKWNGGATVVARPRAAQPSVSWTGCHVAAGGGYGMWNQDVAFQTDPTFGPVTVFTTKQTSAGRGWFGTVGGGCDYQAGGRWVIGAFADYDFSNLKSDYLAATSFMGAEKLRSSWVAGGRVGWLATPAILSYLTGGYTQAHFSRVDRITLASPPVSLGSYYPATTYSGWFLGGGTEIMLAANWFVRSEYRYARYDNEFVPELSSATGARSSVGIDNEPVVQTIRTELVWRWNWSGPVGAAR
jgi:outer membrane immunogenic protein